MASGFMQRFKGKIKAAEIWLGSSGLWLHAGSVDVQASNHWTNAGAPVNGTTLAGYAMPGDLLSDTTNLKLYQNTNTLLSPTWTLIDAASAELPSGATGTFGGGNGSFGLSGNLYRQVSAGINPGATAADNVLAAYSIPAGSFDVAGRVLNFSALGSFAANTNSKRCKIIFNPTTAVVGSTVGSGGTTIADTGAFTTNANVGWELGAQVAKYGAAASNTQIGQETGTIVSTVHGGVGLPIALTAVESGAVLVAVTGNAGTTATDIALNFFEVNAQN